MSRDTVVWTTSKPVSFSADATSACVERARSRTSSRIAFCLSRRFIVCENASTICVRRIGESLLDVVGGDGERGREANDVLAGGEDEEALLAGRIDDLRGSAIDLDPEQQPAPAYGEDPWKDGKRVGERGAVRPDVAEQLLVDRGEDRGGSRARDGVPTERRAVVPGRERTCHLVGDEERADRQAVREALGQGHEIRPHRRAARRRRTSPCGPHRSAPRRGRGGGAARPPLPRSPQRAG